jgi:ComF family protein
LIEYKNGNKNFGSVIAQLLVRTLDFAKVDSCRTVIPIPSSQLKIADRGFDTMLQVCRELKRVRPELQVVGNCLTLRHLVQDQVGLSFTERQANMSSAFRANRPVVGDVILIDDVVTTGATLMNAAKALKIAGAKRVYCITLCGTPNSR